MNKFESSNCPICGQPYCEHVKSKVESATSQEQNAPIELEESETRMESPFTLADIYEVNENMSDQQIADQIVDKVIELNQGYEPIKILLEYERTTPEATDKINIRNAIKLQLVSSIEIRKKNSDFNTLIKDLSYYVQGRLENSVRDNEKKIRNYIEKRNVEKLEV